MNGLRHAGRLSELVAARLTAAAADDDDVARIVLGPRLRDLCGALEVPVHDWLQISRWAEPHAGRRDLDAFESYIDVMVGDRCRRRGDDLLSDLIAFDIDGCGLTADEVRAIVVELVSSAASTAE